MKCIRFLLYFVCMVAVLFTIEDVNAKKIATAAATKKEKTLPCDAEKTQKVYVAMGRLTILSFAVKPKEILPGESSFDFKQIKNDLAIKALSSRAKTNVFVYMAERRCAFDVIAVPSGGDDIIFIKDPIENQMEANFK